MWFHIDPAAGVPIYLQIYNQVKQAVATGVLQAGDQLPSVRELAVQLAINPNTVAKAYGELERDCIIATARGRGTFVAERETRLVLKERERLLDGAIERMLVEAHHLNFTREEVKGRVNDRIDRWFDEKRTGPAGASREGPDGTRAGREGPDGTRAGREGPDGTRAGREGPDVAGGGKEDGQ